MQKADIMKMVAIATTNDTGCCIKETMLLLDVLCISSIMDQSQVKSAYYGENPLSPVVPTATLFGSALGYFVPPKVI